MQRKNSSGTSLFVGKAAFKPERRLLKGWQSLYGFILLLQSLAWYIAQSRSRAAICFLSVRLRIHLAILALQRCFKPEVKMDTGPRNLRTRKQHIKLKTM